MKSWRVTFRCNPYRAQSHFLWINAPEKTTEQEIRDAAYSYNGRLPVDIVDDITKWAWTSDKPDLTLLNSDKNDKRSVATMPNSSNESDNQKTNSAMSGEEMDGEFRSIISHAFLGSDTSDIDRETFDLAINGCVKYAASLLKQKEDEIEFLNKNSDELMEQLDKYRKLADAADAAIYAIDGISESNLNDKIRIYNELKLTTIKTKQ